MFSFQYFALICRAKYLLLFVAIPIRDIPFIKSLCCLITSQADIICGKRSFLLYLSIGSNIDRTLFNQVIDRGRSID